MNRKISHLSLLAAVVFALPLFGASGTGTVRARTVGLNTMLVGFIGTGTSFSTELRGGMVMTVNGTGISVASVQDDQRLVVVGGPMTTFGLTAGVDYTFTFTPPADATPVTQPNGATHFDTVTASPGLQGAYPGSNDAACFAATPAGNPGNVVGFRSMFVGSGVGLQLDGLTAGSYAIRAAAGHLDVFTVDAAGAAWSASSLSVGYFPGAVRWTSGVGAPSIPCPDAQWGMYGSIYSRADSTGDADALYVCTASGWIAK